MTNYNPKEFNVGYVVLLIIGVIVMYFEATEYHDAVLITPKTVLKEDVTVYQTFNNHGMSYMNDSLKLDGLGTRLCHLVDSTGGYVARGAQSDSAHFSIHDLQTPFTISKPSTGNLVVISTGSRKYNFCWIKRNRE